MQMTGYFRMDKRSPVDIKIESTWLRAIARPVRRKGWWKTPRMQATDE